MKTHSKRSFILGAAALAAGLTLGGAASAQSAADWPARPVTVVVGFTAGGPTDVIARILSEQLTAKFGQPFVVENRTGAGGGVAAVQVKKAPADGYTLMFGSSGTLSILPHLQKNLAYDPIRDFTAIGLVASYPYFLVVPVTSPLATFDDLLKKGRAAGSTLSYASAGTGAVNHLAGEWFKFETNVDATHIPYKGDAAAIGDLIAGRVDFAFIAGAAALPQVRGGKLRILASASAVPGRGGDNVLTLGDGRIKGFAAEPWNGLMAPAGTPPEIVAKLNAAIEEIMHRKPVVERLAAMEQYPLTGTPARFTNHIKEQYAHWGTVIRKANIKGE